MITLGLRETDVINRMITLTKQTLKWAYYKKARKASENLEKNGHINRMITITII